MGAEALAISSEIWVDPEHQKTFEEERRSLFNMLEPQRLMDEVWDIYQFRDGGEASAIAQFLMQQPFLLSLLVEASEEIEQIFEPDVRLFLELEEDPEEDFDELFIVIQTDKEGEEALALLSELDETWFLEVLPRARNLLNLTVETEDEL